MNYNNSDEYFKFCWKQMIFASFDFGYSSHDRGTLDQDFIKLRRICTALCSLNCKSKNEEIK